MNVEPGSSSGPYEQAAATYWRAGWMGVLPIPSGAKWPPPDGYTGGKAAGVYPSWPDVFAWIEEGRGGGNVALRLPEHLIGIDVDCYDGKAGRATIDACVTKWGQLPDTWRSTSRSDGSMIAYFRIPSGLAWPGELGPGVELVRHGHRYAIAPPSIHPTTGAPYYWITPAGRVVAEFGVHPDGLDPEDAALLAVPTVEELPDLPDTWVQGVTGGRLAGDVTRAGLAGAEAARWLRARGGGQPCPVVSAAVARFRDDLPSGRARHELALAFTQRLAYLAAEGHTGTGAALDTGQGMWLGAIGTDRRPDEADAEWGRMVAGAVDIAAARPAAAGDPCDYLAALLGPRPAAAGTASTPTAATSAVAPMQPVAAPELPPWRAVEDVPPWRQQEASVPTEQAAPDEPVGEPAGNPEVDEEVEAAKLEAAAAFARDVAAEEWKLRIRDAARRNVAGDRAVEFPSLVDLPDLLARPKRERKYRVEGLWPAGGRVMLAAAFKAGKSTMVGNLLRCLVDGEEFLGRYEVTPLSGNVVLVDNELDEDTLQEWLTDQGIHNASRIKVVSLRGKISSFNILDPVRRETVTKLLRNADAEIAILDCLRPCLDALGLNEHTEAGQFLNAFDSLLDESGTAEGLVVHHSGHGGERARGDSRLRDWPDAEWRIVREREKEGEDPDPAALRFFTAYGRDVDVPEGQLRFNRSTRRLSLGDGNRRDIRNDVKLRRAETDVIAALKDEDGLSSAALERVTGAQRPTRDAIRSLLGRHLIRTSSGPRGAVLHHLVDPHAVATGQWSAADSEAMTA